MPRRSLSGPDDLPATYHILVTEDDTALNTMLCLHLQEAGFLTYGALTCQRAVTLLRQVEFDFVVSDYRLPDGTGLELLRYIRDHYPNLPVLMISGEHDDRLREQSNSLQAAGFLEKPVRCARVEELLRRSLGAPGGPPEISAD